MRFLCHRKRIDRFSPTLPDRLMRFRQSTLKRSKMIKLQAVTYVELYAHATNTRACDICSHRFHFVLLRFRPSTLIRFVCVFVLIHSQGCFQIHAFSMKSLCVLVWTKGLNALKCISLRKQPFQRRRARRNGRFRRLKCIRSTENKAQELYPLLMRFQTKRVSVEGAWRAFVLHFSLFSCK